MIGKNFWENYENLEKWRSDIVEFSKVFIDLDEDQKRVLRNMSISKKYILNSTRQRGKSVISTIHTLWQALFQTDKRIIICYHTQSMAELGRKQFDEYLLKLKGIEGLPSIVVNNREMIKFGNQTIVQFIAWNSDKLREYTPDIVDLQECDLFNDEKYYQSIIPVVTSHKRSQIILSSTKRKRNTYFYQSFLRSQNRKSEWESDILESKVDLSTWDQVQYLTKEQFETEYLVEYPINYPVKKSLVVETFTDHDGVSRILCNDGLLKVQGTIEDKTFIYDTLYDTFVSQSSEKCKHEIVRYVKEGITEEDIKRYYGLK